MEATSTARREMARQCMRQPLPAARQPTHVAGHVALAAHDARGLHHHPAAPPAAPLWPVREALRGASGVQHRRLHLHRLERLGDPFHELL